VTALILACSSRVGHIAAELLIVEGADVKAKNKV
jgi:hypothetical protein